MKVFVADGFKVQTVQLPSKIEDSFLINYVSNTGVAENIVLTAANGHWTINETNEYRIKKDVSFIPSDVINNLSFYEISFADSEQPVKLYFIDTPIKYSSYSTAGKSSISIGKVGTDIIYEHSTSTNSNITIDCNEGIWTINIGPGNQAYVNNKRYDVTTINRGDVIFIDGLRIIWMGTFLMLNALGDKVKLTLPICKKTNYLSNGNTFTPVTRAERAAVLYNENQVFFHTPRFKPSFTPVTINIDPPPDAVKDDGPPAILALGTTVMMGISSSITGLVAVFSVVKGEATVGSAITELILTGTMIVGCVLLPIVMDRYNKTRLKKKEKARQKKYLTYLQGKKDKIREESEKERNVYLQNYLSVEEIVKVINNRTTTIWSREIKDSDFISFRLGLGSRNAQITIETSYQEFKMEDDNLRDEVIALAKEKFVIKDVPITVSLLDNRILPIIISDDYANREAVINNIMLQLVTYHSGADLKIVILTDEKNAAYWDYAKYVPHIWSVDKDVRFFATNESEMKQICGVLESIYNSRLAKNNGGTIPSMDEPEEDHFTFTYEDFDEYYVIITDNFISAKKFGIINKIMNTKHNLGFSLLMIEPSLKNIPSKANEFVQFSVNGAGVYGKDPNTVEQRNFVAEGFRGSLRDIATVLANIPLSSGSMATQLPTILQFLEMYNVGKIEQLNIYNRWMQNDPTLSLKTPIGVHTDGKTFELDLHEKFHGPHGLIAGSTGSGKSEFIITFILSMAISYHPNEVQFVLIDYKGGGLAGAFENREKNIKIPHLVGTITNLDTGEMNRTLVSINSELKRRQRMFNEAREALGESTVDIYKYQKYFREGKVKEPISHLFIISDEFAELKSQQPEFMDELISTARIGRSLGVHLILATQKPSGVVDDQIWSNSKFKICLKVATSEDSSEMLHRTDAASIKETGRFYLQVGYDELFELGQSAWSGAKYVPQEHVDRMIDDSITIIDNSGNTIRKLTDKVKVDAQTDRGEQLTNIVQTLYDIAIRENIPFRQLWLPSIPAEIYLSNIIKKYNYKPEPFVINPVIGEYDLPAMQQQKILTIDLTNTGGLLIYGNPGSGKENLLTTLLYSACIFHTTEEINVYIMDFGAEVLKVFGNIPHVGDVVLIDEKSKIKSLLLMLEREMNRRKNLYSEFGGTYTSYLKLGKKKEPLILVVLNGFEAFMENHGEYADFLAHLVRESYKYGIVFIMTSIAPGVIPTKISQAFTNLIATQLTDPFDYRFYLNAGENTVPSKVFGRGIVSVDEKGYEFQTCYVYLKDQINEVIKSSFEKLNYPKAKHIPVIPKIVTADSLSQYLDNIERVPVGINIYDGSICRFNFVYNRITQIIGNNLLIDNNFVKNLVSTLSNVPNVKIEIIDFSDSIDESFGIDYCNGDFTQKITDITTEEVTGTQKVYLMLGLGYIYDKVLDEGIEMLFNYFRTLQEHQNTYFVFADNYSSYKRIMKEDWYATAVNNRHGIWIGTGIEVQNAIVASAVTSSDAGEEFEGLAYVIYDNNYNLIKSIGVEGDD